MPHVVNMSDEDYAAYQVYLKLPEPLRWTARAVVCLSRSDQRLVRQLVQGLWRTGGEPDGWRISRQAICAGRRVARKLRLVQRARREPAA